MEIALTRPVANWMLEACLQAEAHGRTTVEPEDFNDDPAIKNAATTLPSQNRVDRAAVTDISAITLEPILKTRLRVWRKSPQEFGSESVEAAKAETYGFPGRCFRAKCSANKAGIINQVYSRFWEVIFHRFYHESYKEIGASAYDDMYSDISKGLQQSGLFAWKEMDIQSKLHQWIKSGERYELLIRDLGGEGALLLLPFEHGETFWLDKVPKDGPRRASMITSLFNRGIQEALQQTDTNNTAQEIIKYYVDGLVSWYKSVRLSKTHGNPHNRGMPANRERANVNKIRKRTKAKGKKPTHFAQGAEESQTAGSAGSHHLREKVNNPQSITQSGSQSSHTTYNQLSDDIGSYTVNRQNILPSLLPYQDSQLPVLQHQNMMPYELLESHHGHPVTNITPAVAQLEGWAT